MSVLTTVQVKRIARFLKASCEKIPSGSDCPKLGQWLDILSKELGFRDWNSTSASLSEVPALSKEHRTWPNSYSTFLGLARVLVAGQEPIHHLSYSVNRELTRHQVATELAKKLRTRIAPGQLVRTFHYSQPDVVGADGQLAPAGRNRLEGCPIVIKSSGQDVSIQLWWLQETYLLPESMPAWGKGSPSHYVHFDGDGDLPLTSYGDSELNDSLTDVFLQQLTGKAPARRTCWFVPRWSESPEGPSIFQVEEGNPRGKPLLLPLVAGWDELRKAASAHNAGRGLSSIDCMAISARYKSSETIRNEEDYVEDYSGTFDR